MDRTRAVLGLMLAASFLAGCMDAPPAPEDESPLKRLQDELEESPLQTELVAGGLLQPVSTAFAPGIDNLFWAVEKGGTARIIWDGINFHDPSLDLRDDVESGFWEQGLLAVTFHPEEPRIFVLMTPHSDENATRVEDLYEDEWQHRVALMEFPFDYHNEYWVVNETDGVVLFEIEKPREQHNGGDLEFGPDGMLYVGIGEGGFGELAQSRDNLMGSILRLDVSVPGEYAIPPDNPFVDDDDARDEIWQYGLRNPWRMGFDPENGDLWVTDVGGTVEEEINRIPHDRPGGNYGWGTLEGTKVRVDWEVDRTRFEDPVYVYDTHGEDNEGRFRCAIVGGMVYRGEAIPALQGSFIFSDLCSGAVYALQQDENGQWNETTILEEHRDIVAIEPDHVGEILIVNHNNGTIRRVIQG